MRARGAVQALTDGERAPIPEVVQTPRTGKSLTHRVALFLDPGATAGWHATLTPRAAANAAVSHWLAGMLPAPSAIQWMVKVGAGAEEFIDAGTLRLEPLDLVMMSGERLGDLSSALERLIVYDTREARGIPDQVLTFMVEKSDPAVPDAQAIVFDPDRSAAGKHSLGSVLPLLKSLRRIVSGGRPLGARDLMRPTEAQDAHPENPQGYDGPTAPLSDLTELKTRLEGAHAALAAHHTQLQSLLAAMQPLADALDNNPALPIQAAWTTLVPQLRARLRAILLFGVHEAMPSGGAEITRPLIDGHVAQAAAVELILQTRLAEARTLLDISFAGVTLDPDPHEEARKQGARVAARLDAYSRAARLLLGDELVVVPLFAAHPEAVPEFAAAAAAPIEPNPLPVESWMQALARVRPQMQAWDVVATYQEWMRDAVPAFSPVQLPVAPGAKWIGGSFDGTVKADDVVSIAMHGGPAAFTAPMAGLLSDEWTELVPAPTETTGMAIHVNRPNAVAPHALLVAVAPKQTGRWSWDDLVAILGDTLDRARLRAVEPDAIGSPYFQLLPPIVTAFDHSVLMASAKFSAADIVAGKV
jgi:hypothetical protein